MANYTLSCRSNLAPPFTISTIISLRPHLAVSISAESPVCEERVRMICTTCYLRHYQHFSLLDTISGLEKLITSLYLDPILNTLTQ